MAKARPVESQGAHFSGKRDGERRFKFLDVRVQGEKATFPAMAVDVSPTGVLLRILDDEFAAAQRLDYYCALAFDHFEKGMVIRFGDGLVERKAEIARVTEPYVDQKGLILVGCRFKSRLTPEECLSLGI